MTVHEILKTYLKNEGYDGLYNSLVPCGCELKDLMPCDGEGVGDCEPGYKVPCDPGTCEADGECDWHMGSGKVVVKGRV